MQESTQLYEVLVNPTLDSSGLSRKRLANHLPRYGDDEAGREFSGTLTLALTLTLTRLVGDSVEARTCCSENL